MKQRIIALLLLLGFSLNPAYAGEGINTVNDLFKVGAECIVIAPVVLPVVALKKLIERKPSEAAEMVVATPLIPLMGVTMLAAGVIVKAASYLPKTASSAPVEPRTKGISIGKLEHYQIETAQPDIHIDETHLLSHCVGGPVGHCEK